MARRAQPKQHFTRDRMAGDSGCLVVVTAAEQAQLDLLLTAARRRIPHSTLEFPKRITTRRDGPPDAEIAVTRSLFRQIEQDGGFMATWGSEGHRFGLLDSIQRMLISGRSAVIAAPLNLVGELYDVCPDVRALRLTGQLDAVRATLTPKACLRRIVGPRLAERLESRGAARTIAVPHGGDMPSAVRALSEALARIEQEAGLIAPSTAGSSTSRRSRAGSPARSKSPHAAPAAP
ncbi:MAG TPA: hypothetical protein VF226_11700 [Hyphomicrobiaceae bacterium]